MKKFIAIFAIIATFGFVACNNAAETTEENTDSLQEAATTEVEETPAPAEVDSTATPDSAAAAQ